MALPSQRNVYYAKPSTGGLKNQTGRKEGKGEERPDGNKKERMEENRGWMSGRGKNRARADKTTLTTPPPPPCPPGPPAPVSQGKARPHPPKQLPCVGRRCWSAREGEGERGRKVKKEEKRVSERVGILERERERERERKERQYKSCLAQILSPQQISVHSPLVIVQASLTPAVSTGNCDTVDWMTHRWMKLLRLKKWTLEMDSISTFNWSESWS